MTPLVEGFGKPSENNPMQGMSKMPRKRPTTPMQASKTTLMDASETTPMQASKTDSMTELENDPMEALKTHPMEGAMLAVLADTHARGLSGVSGATYAREVLSLLAVSLKGIKPGKACPRKRRGKRLPYKKDGR